MVFALSLLEVANTDLSFCSTKSKSYPSSMSISLLMLHTVKNTASSERAF